MPLDFSPPKVAVIIDRNTWTRGLVEGSGEFALNVSSRALAQLTLAVGSRSARELNKFGELGIITSPAEKIRAPLVDG